MPNEGFGGTDQHIPRPENIGERHSLSPIILHSARAMGIDVRNLCWRQVSPYERLTHSPYGAFRISGWSGRMQRI
jgi:hypothetical protein